MKSVIRIYSGEDGTAGRAVAAKLRARDATVSQHSAFEFVEAAPCDRVIIMPDVPKWLRQRLAAAYGGKVEAERAEVPAVKVEAPAPALEPLSVRKGPFGRFYVKRGTERIAGPFDSEADAEAAMAEIDP